MVMYSAFDDWTLMLMHKCFMILSIVVNVLMLGPTLHAVLISTFCIWETCSIPCYFQLVHMSHMDVSHGFL